MPMAPKSFYIVMILLFGICRTIPVYADDFLTTQQLLKENKPDEAYQLLTTKEAEHMGEPVYDLLLARTALRSGHPHEAIFAYERVLINKPGNNLARVELAIAYYRINELESSRRLFDVALKANPPDKIKKNIHNYISRINEKIGSRKHRFSGMLTLNQGWDSNINSATNESEIELAIGTYRPTEGVDKETADTFTEVINRLHYNYNFNVNSRLFSSAGYSNRENNNKQFDTQTADIKLGYSHATGVGKVSIPVSYQTMWLDEKQLREVSTISASLNRSGGGSFANYSLQYGEIRYPYQQPLNVDFVAASFAFGFSNKASGISQQYAVFYGDETASNSLYEFNAREYRGVQVRLPVRVSNRHIIAPKIVYQIAEYNQRHPFFTDKRKDHYAHYEITWRWLFDRKWSLVTKAGHTDSNSSVPLYTFTRNLISTGINYAY